MARAFIGIGANLGDREPNLTRALQALDETPEIRILRRSTLRETEPVGYADQPKFLNGVVELETELEPRALLDRMLQVEASLGRFRERRNGPRTVDLDLLLYDDQSINEPGLQVPHPRMRGREFVLGPLAELEPVLVRSLRNDTRH